MQSFMRAVSIVLCGRPNTPNPNPNRKRKNIFKALIKEPFYIAKKPTSGKRKIANGTLNYQKQGIYSVKCRESSNI